MKKTLLLLALSLQANAQQDYSPPQIKTQGADIETLVETTYKHPEPRKVGDLMPQPEGEIIAYTFMSAINIITGEIRKLGVAIDYDRNEDNIPEYKFIRRFCDAGRDVITYAVYDVPYDLLYIDSSRNNRIDSILGGNPLERFIIPGIPAKCEENEIKKSLKV